MIIYKTTNLVNGKIYIGKDIYNNPNYLGSGLILNISIKKHGKHNFKKEILQKCRTIDKLNEREIYWIKKFKSTKRGIGYNIAGGGFGGDTYAGMSANKKRMIFKKIVKSRMITISNNPEIRINAGIKISKTKTGCVFSKKHKENLSLAHIGQNAWNKGIKMPLLSEKKKIKIDINTKKLIINLYSIMSPQQILYVIKTLNILSASIIVIRRLLKEEGVYVSDNTRLRNNPTLSKEDVLKIAENYLKTN